LTFNDHAGAAARPEQDAARELAFRRSLRASRDRRDAADRTRRWTLRRRASIVLTALATTGLAGGAMAHQTSGGAGSSTSSSSTSLRTGAQGSAVRALQLKLGIAADGAYGPQTRAAVKAFQRRNGLAADGIAGPATLRALGLSRLPVSDAARAASTGISRSAATTLQRIALCESGGNPRAVSASGSYRGKYQFDRATWRAIGGSGDPAAAPEPVQDRLAAQLLATRGTAPWPTCG
jgi:hypothetical protein